MDATSELTTPDTNDQTPCHVVVAAVDADLDPDHGVDDLAHDPHADDEGNYFVNQKSILSNRFWHCYRTFSQQENVLVISMSLCFRCLVTCSLSNVVF